MSITKHFYLQNKMSMVAYPQSLFDGGRLNFLPNKLNTQILRHRVSLIPIAISILLTSLKYRILRKKINFYFNLPTSLFMHCALTMVALGQNRYLDDGIRFITIDKVIKTFQQDQWIKSYFSDHRIPIPENNLICSNRLNKTIYLNQLIEFLPDVDECNKTGLIRELSKFLANEKDFIFLEHPKSSLVKNEISHGIKGELKKLSNLNLKVDEARVEGTKRFQIETTSNLITFWSSAIILHIYHQKPKFITLLNSNLIKHNKLGMFAQEYLIERMKLMGYTPVDEICDNTNYCHLKIEKFILTGV